MGEIVEQYAVYIIAIILVVIFVKPILFATKDGVSKTAEELRNAVPKKGGKGGGNSSSGDM